MGELTMGSSGGKRKFLNIDKNGVFFETSMTPKEGYEEYVSKTNKLSYRKYYPNTAFFGRLNELNIRENQYIGRQFQIILRDDNGDSYDIEFGMDLGTSLSPYLIDFVKYIPNLKPGKIYGIISNQHLKSEAGNIVKMFSILDMENVDKNGKAAFVERYYGKANPFPEIKEFMKSGKRAFNTDERDEYVYGILMKFMQEVNSKKKSYKPNPTSGAMPIADPAPISKPGASPTPSPVFPPDFGNDDDNNLPF